MCVTASWTALEIACQDALECADIGYSFRKKLDQAIAAANFPPLDWSRGTWQKVQQLQELRKSYVHRFASLEDMFPDAIVAEDAIETVRDAIKNICGHVNCVAPNWIDFDEASGWPAPSMFGRPSVICGYPGIAMDDPLAVRVFLRIDGNEQLVRIFPPGYDPAQEIKELLQTLQLPVSGVSVYENGVLIRDLVVNMRGGG